MWDGQVFRVSALGEFLELGTEGAEMESTANTALRSQHWNSSYSKASRVCSTDYWRELQTGEEAKGFAQRSLCIASNA